jgi:hypothetical protein
MEWFTKLFSGADNKSPAIGRVLGAMLFFNMLTLLPTAAVVALFMQGARWDVWTSVFTTMVIFVPAIVGSIVVLINVTNSTEPRP